MYFHSPASGSEPNKEDKMDIYAFVWLLALAAAAISLANSVSHN